MLIAAWIELETESGLAEAKEEVKKAAARQKAIDNGTYFSSPAGKNGKNGNAERYRKHNPFCLSSRNCV